MSQNPHTVAPHPSAAGRTTLPEITLTEADREALRQAVLALEGPSYVARLSTLAGRPIELLGQALPTVVSDLISRTPRRPWPVSRCSPWADAPVRTTSTRPATSPFGRPWQGQSPAPCSRSP